MLWRWYVLSTTSMSMMITISTTIISISSINISTMIVISLQDLETSFDRLDRLKV